MSSTTHPHVSATMRCILVPEIQHLIFDYVYHQSQGSKALAILARTVQCFTQVALGTLWHTQCSLAPLVKCFPTHLWDVVLNSDWSRTVTLVSEPQPDDWSRVKVYAAIIKCAALRPLDFPSACSIGRLAGEAYVMLKRSSGGKPLLPNLYSFEWAQSYLKEEQDLAALLLLLGPQVSTIDVTMTTFSDKAAETVVSASEDFGHDPAQLRSLHRACTSCPRIEHAVLTLGY